MNKIIIIGVTVCIILLAVGIYLLEIHITKLEKIVNRLKKVSISRNNIKKKINKNISLDRVVGQGKVSNVYIVAA